MLSKSPSALSTAGGRLRGREGLPPRDFPAPGASESYPFIEQGWDAQEFILSSLRTDGNDYSLIKAILR
jgi:hypothetical protein